MLNILFIPTTNSGVTFWRMANFWPAIHRQRLATAHVLWWRRDLNEMHPWEREVADYSYMWRITKELQEYILRADVVVIQMLHTENGLGILRAIRDLRPELPVLAEIDDNMMSTPTYNPADTFYEPGSKMRQIAIDQFKESDGIVVSTPYLAEVYSEFSDNVQVIPNCIDFELWDGLPNKHRGGLRIGWAGGATHQEDLRILENLIPKINEKHPEVKWVFLHGCPDYLKKLPQVQHVQSWFRIDKYPRRLAEQDFDIGIAPLVDNAFNRGKSNLRWLEYSALGIPTVASKVGHFRETVTDGIDGLLAETSSDFENCLELLISNKAERKRIGQTANARIRRDFNTEIVARQYVSMLEKVVENHRQRETKELVA